MFHLHSADDPQPGDEADGRSGRSDAKAGEDLPYKVELWDDAKRTVEQVLAVTASSSIGYAAYYAATRDFAGRFITLRHKGTILIRWNAPNH